MKIIDYVEFLLKNHIQEGKEDKSVLDHIANTDTIFSANPEEAKIIVKYFIEDLIRLYNKGEVHEAYLTHSGELALQLGMSFNVSDKYDIVTCMPPSYPTGHCLYMPYMIDKESYNNIMSAIRETNIFNIFRKHDEKTGADIVTFEVFLERLKSYQNIQEGTSKKL